MQVDLSRIPSQYILQRYTRNARKDLPFDRVDRKLHGRDGDAQTERNTRLMVSAMRLVKQANQSQVGCDRAVRAMDDAWRIISRVAPDIGQDAVYCDSDGECSEVRLYAVHCLRPTYVV